MQCEDIPDRPILAFLAQHEEEWSTWFDLKGPSMPTVRDAMPPETPPKLRLAKMNVLIRRGLVRGCGCGCRGDFVITDAGKKLLREAA